MQSIYHLLGLCVRREARHNTIDMVNKDSTEMDINCDDATIYSKT